MTQGKSTDTIRFWKIDPESMYVKFPKKYLKIIQKVSKKENFIEYYNKNSLSNIQFLQLEITMDEFKKLKTAIKKEKVQIEILK